LTFAAIRISVTRPARTDSAQKHSKTEKGFSSFRFFAGQLATETEERTILEYARKHISLIWIEDSAKSLALPKVNCLTPSQVDSSSEKVLEEGGRCAAGTRLRTRFARRYALTAVALQLGSDSFGGFLRKNRSRFISSCKRAPSKPALYTLRLLPKS
jgi:hypothetical protein